jgi:hypothetical protein
MTNCASVIASNEEGRSAHASASSVRLNREQPEVVEDLTEQDRNDKKQDNGQNDHDEHEPRWR